MQLQFISKTLREYIIYMYSFNFGSYEPSSDDGVATNPPMYLQLPPSALCTLYNNLSFTFCAFFSPPDLNQPRISGVNRSYDHLMLRTQKMPCTGTKIMGQCISVPVSSSASRHFRRYIAIIIGYSMHRMAIHDA